MKTLLWVCAFAISSASASAKLVQKTVSYEHQGTQLQGFLAYDDAMVSDAQRAPGVLLVHEWWGLTDFVKGRATDLAQRGYVAFALDMFGEQTDDPKKAQELASKFYGSPLMAERAQAGLDQLMKTGLVSDGKVAAMGFCFGGTTSLALSYTGAPLAGVVTFHAGLIPSSPDAVAKIKAKYLILHGAVDGFVKPEDITAFTSAFNAGKIDYQFISYSGAVHSFTNPNADKFAANGLKGVGYNEPAARRSWIHMLTFLNELFLAPKS